MINTLWQRFRSILSVNLRNQKEVNQLLTVLFFNFIQKEQVVKFLEYEFFDPS